MGWMIVGMRVLRAAEQGAVAVSFFENLFFICLELAIRCAIEVRTIRVSGWHKGAQ
jgi:hypothetical protein